MTRLQRATCPVAEPSHHFLILVQGKMPGILRWTRRPCPGCFAKLGFKHFHSSSATESPHTPSWLWAPNAVVVGCCPCLLPDPGSIFLPRNFLVEDTFLIHHLPYPSWCSQNTFFLPLSRTGFQRKECSERQPFS